MISRGLKRRRVAGRRAIADAGSALIAEVREVALDLFGKLALESEVDSNDVVCVRSSHPASEVLQLLGAAIPNSAF